MITWDISRGTFVNGTPIINEISPNRFDITLDFAATVAGAFPITITSDSPNDQIAEIEFTASGPGTVIELRILGDELSGAISSLEVIEYIDPPAPRVPAGMSLFVELHPTLGTGRIGRDPTTTTIEVESNVTGIDCREITANIVANGSISNVVVEGDVIGNITAGTIFDMDIGGDLGPQRSGADLQLNVTNNVQTIEATNVYADIDVGGNMRELFVYGSSNRGDIEADDAVFSGSLSCDTMNGGQGLRVWGSVVSGPAMNRTSIDIADEMDGISSRIAIGKDLEEHASITVGSGGMFRGITIGWMDGTTGSWYGDITVDGALLSPVPDYEQTGLGGNPTLGGAVGLVPYGAHYYESFPAYDVNTGDPGTLGLTATNPSQEITIAHYGIIGTLPGAPAKPYVVYEAPGSHCTSGCSAELFSNKTSEWTTVGIGDGTNAIGFRDMKIRGIARFNQHYHVDVNGTLRCRDVFGEPTTAATRPYSFIFNTN